MKQKKSVKPSYRFYRGCYRISRAIFGIFFRLEIIGREKIPKGAAMICSNHSSVIDPLLIAFAFGIGCFLHFIAKVEVFKIPILSFIVMKLGAISVDRAMMDVATIKKTFSYFKMGEKVAIFPEGTRKDILDTSAAKNGAVKIAEYAEVPIVPVYVPRKKNWFGKVSLVIGEPYYILKEDVKRTVVDYTRLSGDLMARIEALKPKVARS